MKKFSLVAAAAVVAGAMLVPTASAEVPKDVFETELKDVRSQTCDLLREIGYDRKLEEAGVKTRNDQYDWIIKGSKEDEAKLPENERHTDAQLRQLAGIAADKSADCGFVSYPVTQRITAFFGSKGKGSSFGSFSS